MKVDKDHDRLRQLILLEEFKRCLPREVKTYVDEQKVDDLESAARLADDYSLTHKKSFVDKQATHSFTSKGNFDQKFDYRSKPTSTRYDSHSMGTRPKTQFNTVNKSHSLNVDKTLTCTYCKKPGHLISECFKLKRRQSSSNHDYKPSGFTRSVPKKYLPNSDSVQKEFSPSFDESCDIPEVKVKSSSVMEVFEPFISNGFVSLSSDSSATPIRILRDTGASQSLILADALPFSEESSCGSSVLIQGVDDSNYTAVPLHNVCLSSDLVSGNVVVGVRPFLPFEGIHLLLGNDLAGGKVVANPLLTDKPSVEQSIDPIEQEIPGLYPACAVTRAMSKKAHKSKFSAHSDV